MWGLFSPNPETAYRLLLAQLSKSVNKVSKSSSLQDDIIGTGKPHVKQLSDNNILTVHYIVYKQSIL